MNLKHIKIFLHFLISLTMCQYIQTQSHACTHTPDYNFVKDLSNYGKYLVVHILYSDTIFKHNI